MPTVKVTCTAPVNIAVVKYWGKRDEKLILPVNSSLSGTIHQGSMRSKTTMTASTEAKEHTMTLNGKQVAFDKDKRLQAVFQTILARAQDLMGADGKVLVKKGDWKKYKVHVDSANDFPTAAGLASSASGLACFTVCLATLFCFKEAYPGELTSIARQGSGSASRSLHGGFVMWDMGQKDDGTDSVARQIVTEEHWPEMRVLIVVAGRGPKDVGSTPGMQASVENSELLAHRASEVVPGRMEAMKKALKEKDFPTFAHLTMKDSNQFHAICLDTLPPLFYMNSTSQRVVQLVHAFNKAQGKVCVAYTFDAGPHAVLYLLEDSVGPLMEHLLHYFHPSHHGFPSDDFINDRLGVLPSSEHKSKKAKGAGLIGDRQPADANVTSIIASKIGPGAQITERCFAPKTGGVEQELPLALPYE